MDKFCFGCCCRHSGQIFWCAGKKVPFDAARSHLFVTRKYTREREREREREEESERKRERERELEEEREREEESVRERKRVVKKISGGRQK